MKAWYFAATFALATFVATVLSLADVRAMLILGWFTAILCISLGVGYRFGFLDAGLAITLAIIGAAALIVTILGAVGVFQKVVPYCGDGICAQSECAEACADCGAGMCENGICESFERCDTSDDCLCRSDYICMPGRNGANERGCAPVVCGDTYCDAQESKITCCADCGCQDGFSCRNSICLFDTPRITFIPKFAALQISAASLAANPSLTKDGVPTPILVLELEDSVSAANDVVVTASLANLSVGSFKVGALAPGARKTIAWYLEGPPASMYITQLWETNITVQISYRDNQGVAHQNSWAYPMNITPRNTIDAFGHRAMFVTPADVPVTQTTPKRIWEELGAFAVIEDELRFPAYTLEHRNGSRESLALVLASAFMHAGLRTSLVESDYGLFVRFPDNGRYIVIDPGMLGARYEDAIVRKPGYAVYDIEQMWNQLNLTSVSATN